MSYRCILAVSLLSILASSADAFEPYIMSPGPIAGFEGAACAGISGDGSTLIMTAVNWSTDERMSYRWTVEEGYSQIGDLPGGEVWSSPAGVSADGSVIVGHSDSVHSTDISDWEAFKWTPEAGMVGLGDLSGGAFDSRAHDVSADGSVIVGRGDYNDGGGYSYTQPVRWTADGGIEAIPCLNPGGRGRALGVSADGRVIVGTSPSEAIDNDEAFLWSEETGAIGLGNLGGEHPSQAWDASADGSVVVGKVYLSPSAYEAFRWMEETGMQSIGDLPGGSIATTAKFVSLDGSTIYGNGDSEHGSTAFVWDEGHGMRALYDVLETEYSIDLSEWPYNSFTVAGVSDDGLTLAGTGIRGDHYEPWIVRIPEPSSLILLLWGGIVAVARPRSDR